MNNETWLDGEEMAYPNGAMRRKGRARVQVNPHNPVVLPYGKVRSVRAGIPDTYFTIPARLLLHGVRVKGYLSMDTEADELIFQPSADPERCTICKDGEGCKR